MRTKFVIPLTWEFTTVHFMDLYVGAPEKIHRHVWLERLHWLYQHEECEIIVDYVFTHSAFTNSIDIDPFQVIIMDENHVTVRCPLHRHVNIGHIRSYDRTQDQYYLPQQYGPVAGEGDPGTLKPQRKTKKRRTMPLLLYHLVLIQVPCLAHNRTPLGLERDPPQL